MLRDSIQIKYDRSGSDFKTYTNFTGTQIYKVMQERKYRLRIKSTSIQDLERDISVEIYTGDKYKVNHIKTKRTILTGLIHGIDAEIAHKIRVKFECLSVHDCFGVPLHSIHLLEQFYFSQIKSIA
jgi:hypothetical protein